MAGRWAIILVQPKDGSSKILEFPTCTKLYIYDIYMERLGSWEESPGGERER